MGGRIDPDEQEEEKRARVGSKERSGSVGRGMLGIAGATRFIARVFAHAPRGASCRRVVSLLHFGGFKKDDEQPEFT